jgi:hypothetical protein
MHPGATRFRTPAIVAATLALAFAACDGDSPAGPPVPSALQIAPSSPTLQEGGSQQLTATVTDAQGREIADAVVAWDSRTPAVVAVSSTGMLTALAAGSGWIVAGVHGTEIMDSVRVQVELGFQSNRARVRIGTGAQAFGLSIPVDTYFFDQLATTSNDYSLSLAGPASTGERFLLVHPGQLGPTDVGMVAWSDTIFYIYPWDLSAPIGEVTVAGDVYMLVGTLEVASFTPPSAPGLRPGRIRLRGEVQAISYTTGAVLPATVAVDSRYVHFTTAWLSGSYSGSPQSGDVFDPDGFGLPYAGRLYGIGAGGIGTTMFQLEPFELWTIRAATATGTFQIDSVDFEQTFSNLLPPTVVFFDFPWSALTAVARAGELSITAYTPPPSDSAFGEVTIAVEGDFVLWDWHTEQPTGQAATAAVQMHLPVYHPSLLGLAGAPAAGRSTADRAPLAERAPPTSLLEWAESFARPPGGAIRLR